MHRKEPKQKTASVILSHPVASRLVSAMRRPPTITVILSPAKDLAAERIAAVARDADFLSAGQMLHFVQHDKRCRGYFIRSRSAASQLASAMKRLPNLLLIAAIVLSVTAAGCQYWAGPLPLGTTNDVRVTANSASHEWAEPMDLPGLPNLHKVSDDLYRGAQPTAEGIRELEKLGVKTVVNLRDDYSNRKEMRGAAIACERIPMTAWYVQDDDIVQFLRTVTDEHNTPIFVHCRRGADRTGLSVAVYRIAVQDWTKDEAIAEMTQGGFAFYSGWKNLVRYLRDVDIDRLRSQAGLIPEAN